MNLTIFSLVLIILVATSMIGISMVAFRVAITSLIKINQLEESLARVKPDSAKVRK